MRGPPKVVAKVVYARLLPHQRSVPVRTEACPRQTLNGWCRLLQRRRENQGGARVEVADLGKDPMAGDILRQQGIQEATHACQRLTFSLSRCGKIDPSGVLACEANQNGGCRTEHVMQRALIREAAGHQAWRAKIGGRPGQGPNGRRRPRTGGWSEGHTCLSEIDFQPVQMQPE